MAHKVPAALTGTFHAADGWAVDSKERDMNNNRIVWGVILVVLIVAAIAYFGTVRNLDRGAAPSPADPQSTEQETH